MNNSVVNLAAFSDLIKYKAECVKNFNNHKYNIVHPDNISEEEKLEKEKQLISYLDASIKAIKNAMDE